MELKWNRFVVLGLISILYSACAPRNIMGSYAKKLGTTNYYEILNLGPNGRFSYNSSVYLQANRGPYMPEMTSPPDFIGKGTYTLDGRYVVLKFEGEEAKLPVIEELNDMMDNGKYQLDFRILDGLMMDGSGLPFATIARYDRDSDIVIDGTQTDFDGKGSLFIEPTNFPCHLRISFIGYKIQELYFEKPGGYLIELLMDNQTKEISGKRRYKVLKKEGRLIIDGMKR